QHRNEILKQLKKHGEIKNYITDTHTVRGKDVTVQVNAYYQDGIITGMILDVTEMQNTQKKFFEKRFQLDALFNAALDSIYFTDLKGNFIDVNQQACSELGYTMEEFLQMKITDIDDELNSREEEIEFWEKLPVGKPVMYEVDLKHKLGHKIPYEIKTTHWQYEGNSYIYAVGRNLSQRSIAEKELKKSEERYRRLLSAMNEVVFMLDNEWKFVIVNEVIVKMSGLPKEELLGVSIENFFEGLKETKFFNVMRQGIEQRKEGRVSGTYEFAHDDIRWFDLRVSPVQDGILCIATDITQQYITENELKDNKERLQITLDASKVGTWYWNIPNNEMHWDDRMCQIFDEPLDTKKTYDTFVICLHGEDVGRINNEIDLAVRTKGFFDTEYRIVWKNDEVRDILAKGSVLYDSKKNPEKMYGVCIDITERKQAVKALQSSEQKYKNLLENIPQKVYYKDLNLRYLAVNSSFASDFEKQPEDFIGKTDYDLFKKTTAVKRSSNDAKVLQAGQQVESDESYITKSGEEIIHSVKTPVKNRKGEIIGLLGVFWDIT
ncbi:MAG: PAS domain S-box protein, partial [Bacteroidales bacterium]|nr:PAS domain S-box protein [Bacteroidales bacterium]